MVDWERQVVTCPAGQQSLSWLPHTYPASGMAIEARFARQDCTPCAFRARCTRAQVEPRILGLEVREQSEALQAARTRQTTAAFQHEYAVRSGIESTHAQAIRRCGLRQCRSLGLANTLCRRSSPPPRAMSCGCRHGWGAHLGPRRAAHQLRPSRRRRSRGALKAKSPLCRLW
jgi:Transposase DDE domain